VSYWVVWPTVIISWLVLGWAAFALLETRALKHAHRKDQVTLSFFLYTIGAKFPLSIFLAGLLIGLFFGSLATHVLWHWCPAGSISAG
jgi:hypothetical protein